MPEDRINEHLTAVDTADDWSAGPPEQHAPSYDEWNAIRVVTGKPGGTFTEYMIEMTARPEPDSEASWWVRMLARRWAREDSGAGELPADWIDGPVPF